MNENKNSKNNAKNNVEDSSINSINDDLENEIENQNQNQFENQPENKAPNTYSTKQSKIKFTSTTYIDNNEELENLKLITDNQNQVQSQGITFDEMNDNIFKTTSNNNSIKFSQFSQNKLTTESCPQNLQFADTNNIRIDLDENFDKKTKPFSEFFMDPQIDNDLESIFESYFSLSFKILKLAAQIIVFVVFTQLRVIVIFFYTRNLESSITEAVTTMSIVYDLFFVLIPWSITQSYGFKSCEVYSAKKLDLLENITAKLYFVLGICSIIVGLVVCFVLVPIFVGMSVNNESIEIVKTLLLILSFGAPFCYLQFGTMRYLFSRDLMIIPMISIITSVFFQLLVLSVYDNYYEKSITTGIAISIDVSFFISFLIQIIYICCYCNYKDNIKEAHNGRKKNDNVFYAIFDSKFPSFLSDLFLIGGLIFLSSFSFYIFPYLALLIGDTEFTVINIIFLILVMCYTFTDAVSAANNLLINYLIGTNNFTQIINVLNCSLIIITIYVIVIGTLTLFFFESFVSLFTIDQEIISSASSQNVAFFVNMIFISFLTIISETLAVVGKRLFSLFTLVLGRYLISICFMMMFIYMFEVGLSSILFGYWLGQAVSILCNIICLKDLFANGELTLRMSIGKMQMDELK